MNNLMLPLPGLSPVSGKTVVVNFDGGLLSSDGGILVLREVEQRLRVADRLAACIEDPRSPEQITHSLADIIRFRLLMISAGYMQRPGAGAISDHEIGNREGKERARKVNKLWKPLANRSDCRSVQCLKLLKNQWLGKQDSNLRMAESKSAAFAWRRPNAAL
jgi:Transposase DDE domain group 1